MFTHKWWGMFPIYWDPKLVCLACLCSLFRAWRLLAPPVQQKEPQSTFLKKEKLTRRQTWLRTSVFVKVNHHFSMTLIKWHALSITGSAPLPVKKVPRAQIIFLYITFWNTVLGIYFIVLGRQKFTNLLYLQIDYFYQLK